MIGFLFSLLKGIYNTCAILTKGQASVKRTLLAGFFSKDKIRRIFWSFLQISFFNAQISEYNKKLSTKPNTYDTPLGNTTTTPTAPSHLFNSSNHRPYK